MFSDATKSIVCLQERGRTEMLTNVAILVFLKPNLVFLQWFGLYFCDLVYSRATHDLEICVVNLANCGFQLSLLSRMMPRYLMSFFSQIC